MRIQDSRAHTPAVPPNRSETSASAASAATIEEASKNAAGLTRDENGGLVGYGTIYRLDGVEFVVPEGYDSIEQ